MYKYYLLSFCLFIWKYNALDAQKMVVQMGHSGRINTLAFSTDSKLLASGSDDHTVKVWEVSSGRLLHTLAGHKAEVNSLTWSSDGKILVSSSNDSTIKIWDIATWSLLSNLELPNGPSLSIALGADGKTLFSGNLDGTIKVWDLLSGKIKQFLDDDFSSVKSISLSLDNRILASGGYDNNFVKIWDLPSGHLLHKLEGHTKPVTSVCISADRKSLVSGSYDGTAKVWEISSGRLLRTVETQIRDVFSVALSPDGKTIVTTGRRDKTIRFWDFLTGSLLRKLEGHTSSSINTVSVSADGNILASGDIKTIRVWEMASGRQLHSLEGQNPVTNVIISGDGKTMVTKNYDGILRRWEVASGQLLPALKDIKFSSIHSIDGESLVASDNDSLWVWETINGRLLEATEFDSLFWGVKYIALSVDNKTLASVGFSGDVMIWDLPSGRLRRILYSDSINIDSTFAILADVEIFAMSADGKTLVSANDDDTMTLWDIINGRRIRTIEGEEVESLALSLDAKILVTGSWDNTVKVWDLASGRLLQTFEGHEKAVNTVALSMDQKIIASGSYDHTIKVWDLIHNRLKFTLKGHVGTVNVVTISPDGKTLISGGNDGLVKCWDLSNGVELWSLIIFDDNTYLYKSKWGLYKGSTEGLAKVHYVSGQKSQNRPWNDPYYVSDLNLDFLRNHHYTTKFWLEFQNEKVASKLFAPKNEFETQQIFEQRQERARAFEASVAEKYRKRHESEEALKAELRTNLIKNSYQQITLNIEEVGTYDADKQMFLATIDQKEDTLWIPLSAAPSFKENWQQAKVVAEQQLKADGVTTGVFNIKVYHPITKELYLFGEQRLPLYLERLPQNYKVEEIGIPRLLTDIELEEPSGNNLLDAKEHGLLKLRIKNDGKGTANNLITEIVWAKIPNIKVGLADTIKTLIPGASASIEIPLQAGLYAETGSLSLNLSFREEKGFPPAPINIRIGIQGLKPPTLEFVNAGILEEEGNGNNIIENGEIIKVSAIIRNAGELPAENTTVNIIIGNKDIVALKLKDYPLSQSVGTINANELKTVHFVFSVNYLYQGGDNLPIQLQLSESFKKTPKIFSLGLKMKTLSLAAKDVSIEGKYGLLGVRKDRALLFAVSDYADDKLDLKNPVFDAQNLAKELHERYGFETEVVPNPTYDEMEKKIREYEHLYNENPQNRYHPSGQLLIYFTGHGVLEDGSGYFLPKDVDSKRVARTAFAYPIWKPIINNINCDHILVAIDACFSGTFDEKIVDRSVGNEPFKRPGENPRDKVILEHLNYNYRYYLTSGASVETPDKSNFAKQFLEGLRSYKGQNGVFTIMELYSIYINKARPSPLHDSFGKNDPGSSFLFIEKQ